MNEMLQYGALGLLAVVLGAIGLWLRDYLKRRDDREDKHSEYLKALIDDDRKDREKREGFWQKLVEEDIKAKLQLTEILENIATNQAQIIRAQTIAEKRSAERHRMLLRHIVPECGE